MTFTEYTSGIEKYIEERDRVYHTLSLVSDTTNLLEKIKYFRNQNDLLVSEIGNVLFRLFSLNKVLQLAVVDDPFDLEDYLANTAELESRFTIGIDDLMQSFMMETGIISSIMLEYMKYEIEDIKAVDLKRLKASIYSYALYILIITCKFNFKIENVMRFNIDKLRLLNTDLNIK